MATTSFAVTKTSLLSAFWNLLNDFPFFFFRFNPILLQYTFALQDKNDGNDATENNMWADVPMESISSVIE